MGSILINKRPGSLDIKPASQTKPVRINNFIYLSEGASNSYLIETTDGNILINDRTKHISDISYEPNQGFLINNKNFDEFIDSTNHVKKNDNYILKFKTYVNYIFVKK